MCFLLNERFWGCLKNHATIPLLKAVQYQPKFKRRVNDLLEAEVASRKGKLSKLESQLLKEQVNLYYVCIYIYIYVIYIYIYTHTV